MSVELSCARFLAFVASKPEDEPYNPWDGQNCAVGQFLFHEFPLREHDAGFDMSILRGAGQPEVHLSFQLINDPIYALILGEVDDVTGMRVPGSWTWGALRKRLEAHPQFMDAVAEESVNA